MYTKSAHDGYREARQETVPNNVLRAFHHFGPWPRQTPDTNSQRSRLFVKNAAQHIKVLRQLHSASQAKGDHVAPQSLGVLVHVDSVREFWHYDPSRPFVFEQVSAQTNDSRVYLSSTLTELYFV